MSTINSIGTPKFQLLSAKETVSKASQDAALISPTESSKVTLSPDARVIANFASKGISISLKTLSEPLTSKNRDHENFIGTQVQDKSISKEDLDKLLLKLGATDEEKDKIKSGLDNNKDGAISHDEVLTAIASTLANNNSFTQTLLGVADRNGDANGTLSLAEFAKLTTAFNDAEK